MLNLEFLTVFWSPMNANSRPSLVLTGRCAMRSERPCGRLSCSGCSDSITCHQSEPSIEPIQIPDKFAGGCLETTLPAGDASTGLGPVETQTTWLPSGQKSATTYAGAVWPAGGKRRALRFVSRSYDQTAWLRFEFRSIKSTLFRLGSQRTARFPAT